MVALETAEKQNQEYQSKLNALEEQLSKSGMFGLLLFVVIFLMGIVSTWLI